MDKQTHNSLDRVFEIARAIVVDDYKKMREKEVVKGQNHKAKGKI